MTGSNVLKEFLVKIGFKVDETKYRHFQESMRSTAKNAVEMSKTALAATSVMAASLKVAAREMETLYFSSRRTGASAGELKAFGFAAEQIGVSAEKARAAVEGLAAARRTNPGLNGILAGLGIDPRQSDNAKVMVELLGKLSAMPHYQGAQVAQMFGLDEQTFLMLKQGLPEMQKYLALREKMFAAAGINPQDMANRSHEFMGHMRQFEGALGNLADIIAYRLMPWGEKVLDWLTSVVDWLTRADKATDGWSSKILGVLSALAGGSLVKGALSTLAKLAGRGGVAADVAVAEGEAGAGAAAAAGGGLLAGAALPVIIVAAVGAALVWMMTHKDQVRAAAGWVANEAKGAVAAIKNSPAGTVASIIKGAIEAAFKLPAGTVDAAISKAKGVSSSVSGGLMGMLQQFEGHAKNGYGVYRDVAGRLTAGFGHLVEPGEDFSHLDRAGALSLLGKDLAKAAAAVSRLVKVKLTENQRMALADFDFNLGEAKFANSTLLRKLNKGDYEGAANEFQRWNHALINGHMTTLQALTDRRAADAKLFRTPDSRVNIEQKNDYHITSTDPKGAASEVERRQSRINADLVRNFAGAFQ